MQEPIPSDLAALPPGPELAAVLAGIDPHDASDEQLPEVLAAEVRQLSHQQARVWKAMAEIGRRDPMPNLPNRARWSSAEIFDAAVDEIRAELRLTRRAAARELGNAAAVASVPRVAKALHDGTIDRARALVLADGCTDLTAEQTTVLLDEVLPKAGRSTATQLADRVRKIAVALDPAWAERRYKEAVREQRLIEYLNADGSATVSGQNLPADEAAAACARVNALAVTAQRAGVAAKIDHLRAQLFLGLLDGRFHGMSESEILAKLQAQFPAHSPAPEKPLPADSERTTGTARGVDVSVGLGTLLGRDDQPGEIAGLGTIPASVARTVVARQRASQWRFAIVDSAGRLLFDGVTRRRPTLSTTGPTRVQGGSVELHVPVALLTDAEARAAHPAWRALLADLAAQYDKRQPIEQDPTARFAGRPLRRRMQILFPRCTFAGCRRPAAESDLDHQLEHSRGGRSDEANLRPRCRHDHYLKTSGGWRVVQRDSDTIVWISPLGRRHVVEIEPVAAPLPPPVPRPPPPDLDDEEDDPPPF